MKFIGLRVYDLSYGRLRVQAFSCFRLEVGSKTHTDERSLNEYECYTHNIPDSVRPLTWEFPKIRVPYFGALVIRILLFGVLY